MQLKINWFWKLITSNGLIIRYKYLFLTKYVLLIQFSLYLFLICECASFILTFVATYRASSTLTLSSEWFWFNIRKRNILEQGLPYITNLKRKNNVNKSLVISPFSLQRKHSVPVSSLWAHKLRQWVSFRHRNCQYGQGELYPLLWEIFPLDSHIQFLVRNPIIIELQSY